MKLNYASETYVSASAKLDNACDWLNKLGIEYSKTRVGRYKELFASLARHQLTGDLDRFFDEYSFASFVNAAHETAEVIRIYEGLSGQSNSEIVTRLKESIKGHELCVLDLDNRSGRDFGFELAIAAKFVRAGHSVNFGHAADLEVEIDGMKLFVECKRLKSQKQIQKRIREGLKQLRKRYGKSDDPKRSFGMLALSIGKTVNSDLGLLEATNPYALGLKAFAHNRHFIDKYKHIWQETKDKRTLGVAVVLDAPGIATADKKLITCHEVTANNSVPPGSKEFALFLKTISNVFPKK